MKEFDDVTVKMMHSSTDALHLCHYYRHYQCYMVVVMVTVRVITVFVAAKLVLLSLRNTSRTLNPCANEALHPLQYLSSQFSGRRGIIVCVDIVRNLGETHPVWIAHVCRASQ